MTSAPGKMRSSASSMTTAQGTMTTTLVGRAADLVWVITGSSSKTTGHQCVTIGESRSCGCGGGEVDVDEAAFRF